MVLATHEPISTTLTHDAHISEGDAAFDFPNRRSNGGHHILPLNIFIKLGGVPCDTKGGFAYLRDLARSWMVMLTLTRRLSRVPSTKDCARISGLKM